MRTAIALLLIAARVAAELQLSDEGTDGNGAPQITFGRDDSKKAILSVSCEGDWSSGSSSPSAPASPPARTSTTPFFHAPPSAPFVTPVGPNNKKIISLRDMLRDGPANATDCPANSHLLQQVPYREFVTMPNGESYVCQEIDFGAPVGKAVVFSAARFHVTTGAFQETSLYTLGSTWPYAQVIAKIGGADGDDGWDNSDVGGSDGEMVGAGEEATRRVMTKACGVFKICSW